MWKLGYNLFIKNDCEKERGRKYVEVYELNKNECNEWARVENKETFAFKDDSIKQRETIFPIVIIYSYHILQLHFLW